MLLFMIIYKLLILSVLCDFVIYCLHLRQKYSVLYDNYSLIMGSQKKKKSCVVDYN